MAARLALATRVKAYMRLIRVLVSLLAAPRDYVMRCGYAINPHQPAAVSEIIKCCCSHLEFMSLLLETTRCFIVVAGAPVTLYLMS